MTPQARVQAAIEVLDAVLAAAQGQGAPAERVISEWFRPRRFAGSKDRRAVRGLVYAAIRVCGPVPVSGRAALLRLAAGDAALAALFDGTRHAPAPIEPGEAVAEGGLAPDWLVERLAASGIDAASGMALLERAPLDVRVNALKADRATLELPLAGEWLASAQGLRFPAETPVEGWDAFQDGRIEVQDLASQLGAMALGAMPGETVVDMCAGAGGKTLALAADMGGRGRLVACDVARDRLARLAPRAARAGAAMIESLLLDAGHEHRALAPLAGLADAVLVDAPCSGSGTWRRSPEGRWRLTPGELARLAAVQAHVLGLGAGLVRRGGRMVFITCSVLDEEGKNQIDRFLAANPGWRAEPAGLPLGEARGAGTRLVPHRDHCDGFFVARLVRL
ncbi:MAG: RsmB/NOP family class I SAM-dependent RNA methyltransferase [Proteobacteria bacterium]|nr:RsmB/NOP family class I SAM-dependent RNA methyltransferase [Pseudomonadota bacterium]